tara:strand:- start:951 stop:1199 length:249 start_codon:yes stop_codon:yes gene_type:complete
LEAATTNFHQKTTFNQQLAATGAVFTVVAFDVRRAVVVALFVEVKSHMGESIAVRKARGEQMTQLPETVSSQWLAGHRCSSA